jgi:hypothetical protein
MLNSRFEQMVKEISEGTEKEKTNTEAETLKYFLVYSQGGAPEDYSVFYSTLVIAPDETTAIAKYCAKFPTVLPTDIGDDEPFSYGIEEFIPI